MSTDFSTSTGTIRTFSTVDYVVLSVLMGLSAAIGLYHAIKDRIQKKENMTEFLLGGRSMSVVPVALSLSVTFLSAITILGNPAEMYVFNTMFAYTAVAMIFAMLSTAFVFIPFFYRLGITSTFQYLEWRFNYAVRLMGSTILIVQSLLYMSLVLYSPSLALSAVTGLNIWGCVIGIGIVVTFYTSLGGMKAVLWTDSLQFFVMIAGLLAIFIQGCKETGGFSAAWDLAEKRKRIVFDDFSFDPSTRHSVWSVTVGGWMLWTALFGVNQAQVQRCLSTSSVRKAQLAILLNTPALVGIVILCCLIGIVMFAFYADCDPLSFGLIEKTDQLLPLFVMDILGDLRGIPGLFVSCVFSGSLSSISSALNAIATVAFKDFLQQFCCSGVSELTATIINKALVVIFGAAAIALAFLVSQLGSVLQATIAIYGILNGPLFGLFVLAMFFPWTNKWGAFLGPLGSLAFMGWIGIGAFVHKISTATKSPVSDLGCNWAVKNLSMETTTAMTASLINTTAAPAAAPNSYEGIYRIYTISYFYYTALGMTVTVVIGLIISFITGRTKPSSVDPRYICPLFDIVFPYLPECVLKPLRFGVDHKGKYKTNESALEIVVKDPKEPSVENGNAMKKIGSKQGLSNPAFEAKESVVE